MDPAYKLSAEAQRDLREIWDRIAEDSISLADRIESDFHSLFAALGRMPGIGHHRRDLTSQGVRFVRLHSFLVVYQPGRRPVRIIAVLRGRRNVKRILIGRV